MIHPSTPPKASKILLHRTAIKRQKWPGFVQQTCHCTLCLTFPFHLQFPVAMCSLSSTWPLRHISMLSCAPEFIFSLRSISCWGRILHTYSWQRSCPHELTNVFTVSSSSIQVEALSSKAPTAGQIPSALLPMINFTSGNQAEFSSEQLNILLSHTHAYTY